MDLFPSLAHTIERELYHAAAAPTLLLWVLFGMNMAAKYWKKWPNFRGWSVIILSTLFILFPIAIFELFNVYESGYLGKSLLDVGVWGAFVVLTWINVFLNLDFFIKIRREVRRDARD